jgi:hypothetical protein
VILKLSDLKIDVTKQGEALLSRQVNPGDLVGAKKGG